MANNDQSLHSYDKAYAEQYNSFYLHPWRRKHDINVRNIASLLNFEKQEAPVWLDLCCGQAWHFAQFPKGVRKLGVDASAAQLVFARECNKDADFIEANVLEVDLESRSFDLVTCFWAAYCYLGNADRIHHLLTRAASWTRPGGSNYFEILLPSDLKSFNESEYALNNGFSVTTRGRDPSYWEYQDFGGRHEMFSPPETFFIETMEPHFERIESVHDNGFMTHFLALNKHPNEAGERATD